MYNCVFLHFICTFVRLYVVIKLIISFYVPYYMIQAVFTFDKLLQRLQLGKETIPFVIWREEDLFGTHDYPVKIDIPCLFLCLDGEMHLEINLQPYK